MSKGDENKSNINRNCADGSDMDTSGKNKGSIDDCSIDERNTNEGGINECSTNGCSTGEGSINDSGLNEIVYKKTLSPEITLYRVKAPLIAQKREAGQFVVVRLNQMGERIPLTIADSDPQEGTITLVVQEVGATTKKMAAYQQGESFLDVVGPLGKPTEIEHYGTVVCVGGGVGNAVVYPIAKAMKAAGNRVISIIGARTKDLLVLEDEARQVSDEVHVTTDDGSYGRHGFVTDELTRLLKNGETVDLAVAIGPAIMMKAVCDVTRNYNIRTIVSLNSIMVDGTGMCGACRVEVGGQTKFVCVDGPEFDGHQVNFDLLMARLRMYLPEEKKAMEVLDRTGQAQTAVRAAGNSPPGGNDG
jgi:NAD(P)H-flavin reductase